MDSHTKELLATARDHYAKREFVEAEALLHQVIELGGKYPDVYDMLGVIAYSRDEFLEAAQFFERAVEINPSYTEALLNLAVTYNDLGRYEAAERVQVEAGELRRSSPLRLDPFAKGKIANMHADLAQAYAEAGMPECAIEELRKGIDLCPTFADLHTRLGVLYRDLGDLQLAREQFLAARDANPKYAHARVMLGLTLFSLGERDAAIAEWHEAQTLEPDNKSVTMYLRMADASRNQRSNLRASRRTR